MSVNVEALQAHIAKLSADIDLQRQVLKQLERSKSDAQRELNAIRDPMARLPLEISSEIFIRCLPRQMRPCASSAPMLLLNVCNAWTDIALSTPALWASIYLKHSCADIIQVWLQRAGDYPLSISLRKSLDYSTGFILFQHATQLKNLEIDEEELDVGPLTGVRSFPCLETLTIGAVMDETDVPNSFSLAQIIRLLRLAPNLVQFTFHHVSTIADYRGEDLVLPSLLCLKLGDTTDLIELSSFAGDDILRNLSLPALQTLFLPFTYITASDFSLFLKRSSPPLQKLVLGAGCEQFGFSELDEWFRLTPSLTDLELFVDEDTSDDFLSALGNSPSHLLPNLRTLRIEQGFPTESSYQRMLCALSVRQAQIVFFDFKSMNGAAPSEAFSLDVRAGLRQLVEGGMKIRIADDAGDLSF
ncbi:hypothetical protein B0H19DRAFT_482753 [Mycena capillaripes]|nr:hypothetical protein B0H19DRAFT_482753 [Mycena capillaripes]